MIRKIVFSSVLASVLFLYTPHTSYAQAVVCPVDFGNDPTSYSDDPFTPKGDGWHDLEDFSFKYTFTENSAPFTKQRVPPNDTINVTADTGIRATAFTKIFSNYMNVMLPFVSASDQQIYDALANAEAKERWSRIYCLNGVKDTGTEKGSITLKVDAELTARVITGTRYRCEPIDSSATPGLICPDGDHDDSSVCTAVSGCRADSFDLIGEETATVNAGAATSTINNIEIPYRLSLRDIAAKTSSTIKNQFCSTTATTAGNTCLTENYTCVKFGDPIPGSPTGELVPNPGRDPAANGKDGVCYIKADVQLSNVEVIADRLCAEVKTENQSVLTGNVQPLQSKMCHYGTLSYTSNSTKFLKADIEIKDNAESVNSLPFDLGLFQDNGEVNDPNCNAENPDADLSQCYVNGYYRRVFQDRINRYTEKDRTLFDNMKYRVQIASDRAITYDVDATNQNYDSADVWAFDYIEKLGGIALLSEEARLFNPDLLPAGDQVISTAGHSVYLRGGQVVLDDYFATNRDVVDDRGQQLKELASGTTDLTALSQAMSTMEGTFKKPSLHTGGNAGIDALYQSIYNQYAGSLVTSEARDTLQKFKDYIVYMAQARASCLPLVGYPEPCQSNEPHASQLKLLRESFVNSYNLLKSVQGVVTAGANPTLSCNSQTCFTSYIAGSNLMGAFSRGGKDIPHQIRLPIEGSAFSQIAHRSFLTKDESIVSVYSDSASKAYKVMYYNPTGGYERNVLSIPGSTFLDQMDAVYDVEADILYVGFYGERNGAHSSVVNIHKYQVNNGLHRIDQITSSPIILNMEREIFEYFRPGPSFSFTLDNLRNFHVVVAALEGGEATRFNNMVRYGKFSPQGSTFTIQDVATNAGERGSAIPNQAKAGVARLFSETGKSIMIMADGNPAIVYINRGMTGEGAKLSWEVYYQAFIAKLTDQGNWEKRPITDMEVRPYGSLRNVFISPGAVGVTVIDSVSRRSTISRMWDAAGSKRCVFLGNSVYALIKGGSTSCGNLDNIEYVKPNKGDWSTVPAGRPS